MPLTCKVVRHELLPVMTITAGMLRLWGVQLCYPTGPAEDTARALGFTGSLCEHGEYWTMTPPLGVTAVMLVKANSAMGDGTEEVGLVDITLIEPVPRSALDARLGSGQQLPRVRSRGLYKVVYRVTVPSAPFACAVIAAFEDEPTTARSLAHGVVLRRDISNP
jgi:hypothetical protein